MGDALKLVLPRLLGVPLLVFAFRLSGLGHGWQHADRYEFTFACLLAFLGVGFCAWGVNFIHYLVAAFGNQKNPENPAPSAKSGLVWVLFVFVVLVDWVRDCG